MLPFLVVVIVLASLGNILLGLFTLLKNPKSTTNQLFFLFTLSIVSYVVVNSQISIQATDTGALFWVKMVMSIALFINLFFYLLAAIFPQPKMTLKIWWVGIWLVVTGVLVGAVQLNLVFASVKAFGQNSVPGPAMPFFLLHTIILLGGGFTALVKKVRRSTGLQRTQTLLFLFGAILMFVMILVTNLLFVLLLNTSAFIGLLPFYTLIFLGFISYAIIRHRFLDIRLAIVRTVAYVLLVTLISLFYSLSLFGFTRFISRNPITLTELIVSTLLVVVITFSFRLVKSFLDRITKNVLYHQNYDSTAVLQELSQVMASTILLDEVSEKVMKILQRTLNTSALSVVLLKDKHITFSKSIGRDHEKITDQHEVVLAGLIERASHHRGEDILVFEELVESEVKNQMRELNVGVILPLAIKQEVLGGILLGNKSSGEIYSNEDILFLETFVPQLAIAVQNALSFEEIRRFNITLKEEVRKATSELKAANDQLKQLDKLKDEFVSLASHELRTPMTSIKGSLAMILEGYAGNFSLKARKLLTAAFNENDRLIRLVNNLLNSSRIEAGRFTFKVTEVDVHQLIVEVVANLQMAAMEKNVYLKFVGSDQQLMVLADSDKIREVIINFIGNAVKFTTQGGVTLTAETNDKMVVVHVSDTGPGIPESGLKLLFKKFSQVHDKTTHPGGTGLGLYISKQIVEGLGGKIWVASKVGQGSTFSFSLPAAPSRK